MVKSISSRSQAKAQKVADKHGIPSFYDSYSAMLADTSLDAMYNPLPNHLHVPKTIEAIKTGKHALCEKPIALNSREVQDMINTVRAYHDLKVMEALMYRFHPQWARTNSMVDEGKIGSLQTIGSFFSLKF